MASGGNLDIIKQVFSSFKGSSETGDSMKLTPLVKCFNAVGLGHLVKTLEARSFPVFQGKDKKVSIDKCATELIPDVAARFVGEKNNLKGKAPDDDPQVQSLIQEMFTKFAAHAGKSVFKTAKVDDVTARLTDAAGYTGAHKERFGTDGKGKGLEGRKDIVENTGFVGAYKGTGTFGKK